MVVWILFYYFVHVTLVCYTFEGSQPHKTHHDVMNPVFLFGVRIGVIIHNHEMRGQGSGQMGCKLEKFILK